MLTIEVGLRADCCWVRPDFDTRNEGLLIYSCFMMPIIGTPQALASEGGNGDGRSKLIPFMSDAIKMMWRFASKTVSDINKAVVLLHVYK